MQVYVKPTTSTDTFDVSITDKDNIKIREWLGNTELLNEVTPFPVDGVLAEA